ncbi:MAG: diguanylate cyclase [Nevskia sp.]|nr:diguanylate cyclase [Nevskia sp.]
MAAGGGEVEGGRVTKVQSEDIRFVRRIRWLRTLGLGLGFLCVASVFYRLRAHPLLWVLLAFHGFAWPQLAYLAALRSADPQKAEMRNLLADSAMGGVWVALMHFALFPSALLVAMLAMDKIAVGGWKLLGRALALQGAACLLAGLGTGFRFEPGADLAAVVPCLPFLLVYPVAVSTATYALARKVRQQNRQLAELSRIDAHTGLLNRSHWENAAGIELRRHLRSGRPAALLMVDIDHFKGINDRLGHTVGDAVLRRIATVLQTSVRDIDTAGRFGGDEFGLVLAETDGLHALEVAERIRQRVQDTVFPDASGLRCSISIGAAEAADGMADTKAWIGAADKALYAAKSAGRNRVSGAPQATRSAA